MDNVKNDSYYLNNIITDLSLFWHIRKVCRAKILKAMSCC